MATSPFVSGPRRNTFDTVDGKLAEAEFFLQRMAATGMDGFAFRCYLSAFLAAGRTTTLALQHFSHISGFEDWYRAQQARLRADRVARFILEARNEHLHGGPYPIAGASFHGDTSAYFFSESGKLDDLSDQDIVAVCRNHIITLMEFVLDCYEKIGAEMDPQQYFTRENFAKAGRSIDDAELEVHGWIMQSLIEEGLDEDNRWHELRGHVDECHINHLFYSYLGKATPQPNEPEHYADFEDSPDDRGWVLVPAGFRTREDFLKQYPANAPTWS